ncbi:hypothetical protein [Caulobacter sp. DWR3-1-2]|uniref:hypothetical protein n=1 Tax=Caulobacter sp. DWR3-1-2 TaxID=2804647 RepID=UPI003CF9D5D9
MARAENLWEQDRWGNDVELTKLATAAAVDARSDSWAQVSGSVYVNRKDGLTQTFTNTRILVPIKNLYVDGPTQINVGLFADTSADCWVIEGGDAAGFRVNFTGGAGGARVVVGAENTSFMYAGYAGSSGASVGAFAVEGVNGLVFCANCYAGAAAPDAFNLHNVLNANYSALFINPVAYNTGALGANVSTNWATAHDQNLKSIWLCGRGRGTRGVTAHFIGATKTYMACPDATGSLGDRMNTDGVGGANGGNQPTEFKVEDTAEAWIDTGSIVAGATGYGAVVQGSAKLHLRNTPVIGSTVVQGGRTVDGY